MLKAGGVVSRGTSARRMFRSTTKPVSKPLGIQPSRVCMGHHHRSLSQSEIQNTAALSLIGFANLLAVQKLSHVSASNSRYSGATTCRWSDTSLLATYVNSLNGFPFELAQKPDERSKPELPSLDRNPSRPSHETMSLFTRLHGCFCQNH